MKPRLAFVSMWDAADVNAESGYPFSMRQQLQKRFDVLDVFPLAIPGEFLSLLVRAVFRLGGPYYHPMREPAALKLLARRIERKLRAERPDVIFSPSSVPMSYVETKIPWLYATDQLFANFIDTYIPRPASRFRRLGHAQEARALVSAARASYPSHWVARTAIDQYGADAAKISVIPWGANLPQDPSDEVVHEAIAARPFDRCRLVFIGRQWERKGGPTLVACISQLARLGLPAHATIIGCAPPALPPGSFMVHRSLDKRNPEHFRLFRALMLDAHFLFMASRAEAYGQAICEAAAFGVPSIGSDVGGIPSIIRDGETGFVRPIDTPPAQFALLIRDVLSTPCRYRRIARQARQDYRERLNWNCFGERISDAIVATL